MFIICANTIEEAERDLLAMKQAVRSGRPIGCGGDTVADVEQAMKCLRNALSASGEVCHLECNCENGWREVERKDGWRTIDCGGERLKLPCDEEEDDYCDGCCEDCDYADECDTPEEEEEECCDCKYTIPDDVDVNNILSLLEKIINHLNS